MVFHRRHKTTIIHSGLMVVWLVGHNCGMTPIIAVRDGFFRDPVAARAAVLAGNFADIANPADGVVYPAINHELPTSVVAEVLAGIEFLTGRAPELRSIFARATYAGLVAENKIHSDLVMGSFAAHVYLSPGWPAGAGTSFWANKRVGMVHKASMDPTVIRTNHIEDWDRYLSVQAAFNRMLIHRGDAWHLAEPVGGWGSTPEDGRLVITAFFDA